MTEPLPDSQRAPDLKKKKKLKLTDILYELFPLNKGIIIPICPNKIKYSQPKFSCKDHTLRRQWGVMKRIIALGIRWT